MTDLEIIDKMTDCLDAAVGWVMRDEISGIMKAAERMAVRIEELEKQIAFYHIEDKRALSFLEGTNREEIIKIANHNLMRYLEKIEELEKRPEIVRCGECKHVEMCNCFVRMPRLKMSNKQVFLDWCSAGVRRVKGEE